MILPESVHSLQAGGQFGLDAAYEPIRLLGRGGTGQTWLCREVASGNEYAVKLQQRPIPRATVRLTYNEITVRPARCSCCCQALPCAAQLGCRSGV
jgi:serine/threonine protein kinase